LTFEKEVAVLVPHRNLLPAYLGERMQLAFVVSDMEKALQYWTEELKVGPFVLFKNATKGREFIHRGQNSPVEMDLAFSYVGELQIEIISQTNSAPSPYSEFIGSGREGVHHVAFWPDDFDGACAALEQSGSDLVCSIYAPNGGGHVNYYTAPAHLGVMLEVAPMTAERVRYFGGIKALADNWDGTRPVRPYGSRAEFMASEDCRAPA
jgi:catechol 2,3-dioxygenase-like lactoylglutathione lyase family enzyme